MNLLHEIILRRLLDLLTMSACKLSNVPLSQGMVHCDEEAESISNIKANNRPFGTIIYLWNPSRLSLSFTAGMLSLSMNDPKIHYWKMGTNVLRSC